MYCRKCGEEIPEGSLQCGKCGCPVVGKSPVNNKKKLVIGLIFLAVVVCAIVLIIKITSKNYGTQGYDDVLNGIEKAMNAEEFTDMIKKKYNGKNGYGNLSENILSGDSDTIAIIDNYCGRKGMKATYSGSFLGDELRYLIVMISIAPDCELQPSEFIEELVASYSEKYGEASNDEKGNYVWETKEGRLTVADTSGELEGEYAVAILVNMME